MSPMPSEKSIEQEISQQNVKKMTFSGKPGFRGDDEKIHGVHCFLSSLPMGARRRDLASIAFGCGEGTISELRLLLSHCP